ncbi:HPr family phosphocarrier protein [Bacillus pinisoli]|uniref:HPr family phosphocarrier protein n=1 Tax=Bacillus pinisoli TaxID=2901866 RepID=UPI001FF360D9|nr:HPr family phosphocarrier protein [Bacillus pinisoli]
MNGVDTKTIIEIAAKAAEFQSSIVLRANNKHIDVKSILGLSVTLVTAQQYLLEIHGPDENEAKTAMVKVFEKNGLNVKVV